jgi:hypothetical protein
MAVADSDLAEAILGRRLARGAHVEPRGRSYRTRHVKAPEGGRAPAGDTGAGPPTGRLAMTEDHAEDHARPRTPAADDEVHPPLTLAPDREAERRVDLACYRCGAPARWQPWGDAWVAACAEHAPEDDAA